VRREAARLGRLVTDMERLSRLEAAAEAIRPREVDVAQAVEAVVAPLRPEFSDSGLSLVVDCLEPCPTMWADPDKFAQILGNLLSNSLRYTPRGGTIKVIVRVRDRMVAFAVEDDGIGIPGEDLPHIFERFYRVDKSRSASGGGSGIGLAVAKALTEQMGGSIEAESLPGTFTRFTFLLPRA
jgi:signal transduction histidine kinase